MSFDLESSSKISLEKDQMRYDQATAGEVTALSAAITQSLVGTVSTDQTTVDQTAVGINSSIELSAQDSLIGVSFSSLAEVDRSNLGILAARGVRANSIKTGILLAGEVEGPVETSLDTRQTLLFGIIVGATVGLVLTIGRMLSRR